jgi:hypothetical protein
MYIIIYIMIFQSMMGLHTWWGFRKIISSDNGLCEAHNEEIMTNFSEHTPLRDCVCECVLAAFAAIKLIS